MSIPYYVVKKGITPGIYRTWNDCNDQIKDYPSPFYKKFDNAMEAYKFLASYDIIELQPQETIQKIKEKETFKEKLINKQKLQQRMIENILEKNE
jgi:viroplasmin and RNaseH domain-containing protein